MEVDPSVRPNTRTGEVQEGHKIRKGAIARKRRKTKTVFKHWLTLLP